MVRWMDPISVVTIGVSPVIFKMPLRRISITIPWTRIGKLSTWFVYSLLCFLPSLKDKLSVKEDAGNIGNHSFRYCFPFVKKAPFCLEVTTRGLDVLQSFVKSAKTAPVQYLANK